MRLRIRLYLARPTSATETAIYSLINYSGRTLKYYTAESILPKYWESDKKLKNTKHYQRAKQVKAFPEYPEFNRRLDDFEATVTRTFHRHLEDSNNSLPTEEALSTLLDAAFNKDVAPKAEQAEARITFMKFFRDYIDRSENGERTVQRGKREGKPITSGTIRTYEVTYNCMAGYEKAKNKVLQFDDITIAFYHDFKSYCMKDLKLSNNYIGKHLKTIKSVMTDAMENYKLHSNRDFESKAFKTIKEDVDGIALSVDELAEFEALDLANDPRLDQTRDWFLIGCNVGQRVSDVLRMDTSMIQGDYIVLKSQKTQERVNIPINDTVRNILAKYGGGFPPRMSDQKFNMWLKDVGRQVPLMAVNYTYVFTKGGKELKETGPKHEFLSSHAMRRSFSTNEYLTGMPIQLIMAITGHTTEANFYKYIKVKPRDKAEQFREEREKRQTKKRETANQTND